jgi:general secretion pathway protein K
MNAAPPCRSKPKPARGAAIVLAMLLAALAATIAVTLFTEQQRWSHAVLHRRDQVQAQAMVFAAVQWSRQILGEDARVTTVDHLGEPWAISLPPIPLDNGEIRGAISDAQGRLDVNALAGTGTATDVYRERITRLLARVGGPVNALPAIADWIDSDATPRMNGAEDSTYLAREVPSVAANAPVLRLAELANVPGVSAAALTAASAHLTALPTAVPINVNTASPEVLAAVFANAGSDAVAQILAARAARPFTSVLDLRTRLPQLQIGSDELSLSVKSDYFLVTVEARQGSTIARARALLRRNTTSREPPEIVWQVIE